MKELWASILSDSERDTDSDKSVYKSDLVTKLLMIEMTQVHYHYIHIFLLIFIYLHLWISESFTVHLFQY